MKNVFRPNYIQTYGELHHSPAKDNLQICLKDFDSMFNKEQDKTKASRDEQRMQHLLCVEKE